MTDDDWTILKAAFTTATTLDDSERAEMLAKFAAEYPQLDQQLKDLLAADTLDDGMLASPVANSAKKLAASAVDPWVGRRIGAWTIKHRIADGGMGAVFLAERSDDEYQQDVALKIMTAQLLAKDAVIRFRAERQILASLSHPNIAKLIDGGSTDENLPYLVLELVDGLPIDEYCDVLKLDISARLQLFSKVCKAVDFAHRNLIVHRDLKPNNILVDKAGEPKLLDFGIAKLLENSSVQQTMAVTRDGMRAMTPEYASPEQVRGEAVTTATDVYSLGVLLYKLLCGRMPYLLASTNVAVVAKAICETVPSRPSVAVTTHFGEDHDAPRIVAFRDTSLVKLQKALSGDLDNIVLATLQKDPERRYPSARALFDDIQRYQAHEPITARPDSMAYRIGKFASRHRAGVSAAVAGLILIISLVSFYTWQVTHERNRAEVQARKAEQVVDFLSGIFASVSPFETSGIEPSVREVLQRGAEDIDHSLSDQPEIHADLLRRLGIIHDELGLLSEAESLLDKSIAIQREIYGEADPRIASVYLARASAHRSAGEFEEALGKAEYALSIALRERPPNEKRIAHAYHLVGNTQANLGNQVTSIEANEKSLEIYARLSPEEDDQYALVLNDIAYSYLRLDDFDTSLRLGTEAYHRKIAAFGRFHPAVIVNLTMLSGINQMRGEMAEAEQRIRDTVEIADQLYGPEHPEYGRVLAELAEFLSSEQRWEETESLLLEAISVLERTYGADHFRTVQTYGALGEVYSETGRHDQALEIGYKTLQNSISVHGPQGFRTAIDHAEYADALLEAYRDDDAVVTFRQSVAIFESNSGGLATAYTQAKLARALLAIGEVEEAASVVAVAMSAGRKLAPPGNSMMARILVASGETALVQGRFDDARNAADQAIEILGARPANPTVWYWQARLILAAVDLAAGRNDLAKQEVVAVIEGLQRDNGTRSRAEDDARLLLTRIEQ